MKKLLFIGMFIVLLSGCASKNIKTSVETLKLTQQTVVNIAASVDGLCSAGQLDQSQCDQGAKLYVEAKHAYGDVLQAELIMIDAIIAGIGQDESRIDYSTQVTAWTNVAAEMVRFAVQLGIMEE